MMNSRIRWITRTAIFIAILVVMQYATAGLGNQYVTGSIVNLILIVSVMTCGVGSGAAVALVSPFVAFSLGIGTTFIQVVPFIALGNLTLIFIWHLLGNRKIVNQYVSYIVALVVGAVAKFVVLYLTVVKLAVPHILKLAADSKPAIAMSLNFSFPQLITAAIGGIVAIAILPVLKKALKRE